MNSPVLLRCVTAAAITLALFGCGKKDEASLLAYVPADTAYVFANLQPMPTEVSNVWLAKMSPLLTQYDLMLARIGDAASAAPAPLQSDDADDADDRSEDNAAAATSLPPAYTSALRVVRELLKELRGADSVEKLAGLGFNAQAHHAVYGVGVWPVIRTELGSVDAFRAFIARVEQNSGSKLSLGKVGDQDYWFVSADKIELVLAIQQQQLVMTAFPATADDALKQRLLGVQKPEQSLAASGELANLIKTERYMPQGAGWLDLRRVFAQYGNDPALAALVSALGEKPMPQLSAECHSEIDGMIAKAPRMIGGYTALSTTRVDSRGRWELDPTLATDLLALATAPIAAGGNHPDALFDLYASIPVLKAKDFLLKQAKATVATPYRCETLKSLNQLASESVEKLSQMLPPPFSDITALRITIDSLILPAGDSMVPDVRGKVLIGTENPSFLIGLAQMAMPSLASVVIKPDAQPVALPTADLPMADQLPPVHVAMAEKALAFSFGNDQVSSLSAYVSAPAGKAGDWITSSYSGELYRVQADLMARLQDAMPSADKGLLDPAASNEINRLYADMFKRFEGSMTLSGKGIEIDQKVELKP